MHTSYCSDLTASGIFGRVRVDAVPCAVCHVGLIHAGGWSIPVRDGWRTGGLYAVGLRVLVAAGARDDGRNAWRVSGGTGGAG